MDSRTVLSGERRSWAAWLIKRAATSIAEERCAKPRGIPRPGIPRPGIARPLQERFEGVLGKGGDGTRNVSFNGPRQAGRWCSPSALPRRADEQNFTPHWLS